MSAAALLSFCDDLFLHGHQIARWITDYVDLEESLAMGSMSQEDLAHASSLWKLAGAGPEARDWLIYRRPAREWRQSRLVVTDDVEDDFAWTIVRGYLLTSAFQQVIDDMSRHDRAEVRQTASVIQAEQQLHRTHWSRWVTLLAANHSTGDRFRQQMATGLALASDLFGDVEPPIDLSAGPSEVGLSEVGLSEFEMDTGKLHQRWRAEVASELADNAIEVPALPHQPTPRLPGGNIEALESLLADLRSVREEPDHKFVVYGANDP